MKIDLGKIVLISAGGHGRVVADIAELNGYSEIVFVDNHFPTLKKNLVWDVVVKFLKEVEGTYSAFVAVGHCLARLDLIQQLRDMKLVVPTLIHPSASVSAHARISFGSVIMPQTVINAGALIGVGAIINSGATVDHDCQIGNGVHISPGAHLAGGVEVGDGSWIGIGSSIRENIKIGKGVMVGAWRVVVKTVADSQTVFGIPARNDLRKA